MNNRNNPFAMNNRNNPFAVNQNGRQGNPMVSNPISTMDGTRNLFQGFAMNPVQVLIQQCGFNIPDEYTSTPESMLNYLLNSGQISQQQLQFATQQSGRLMPLLRR